MLFQRNYDTLIWNRYKTTWYNASFREMNKAAWLCIYVQYPTTVVQCISPGLSNCVTFANLIRKNFAQMKPIWFIIVLSSTYVFKLDITLERYLGNAIFATLHHFRWTIWADIRNITLEKKLENITIVTNNLFTELNITVDVLTSRADPG